MKIIFIVSLLMWTCGVRAQDDLLLQLEKEAVPDTGPVMATFKSNNIINAETNETLEKKNLDFRVTHQFGNIGGESGGGVHTLYGFDQSNDICIALHYGITDRLMAGLSRCKRNENVEAFGKYRLVEQSGDGRIPLAVTLAGNVTMTTKSKEFIDNYKHRFTYFAQVILARKFSSRFSFEIAPAFLHRNIVPAGDLNELYSIGAGARWKFTGRACLIADYFYTVRTSKPPEKHYAPVGAGVEIETGGHVFTLIFTNASGIFPNDFLANTTDDWLHGGIKFSFIISRIFKLQKQPTAGSS